MHRIPQNLFLLSLKQDNFSNSTIIVLGPSPPFIYLKKCDIFSQIQQKCHSQRPVVAPFRDTRAPTSRKYISTELKKKIIFTQIQQKRPSQTPAVAFFRDT